MVLYQAIRFILTTLPCCIMQYRSNLSNGVLIPCGAVEGSGWGIKREQVRNEKGTPRNEKGTTEE